MMFTLQRLFYRRFMHYANMKTPTVTTETEMTCPELLSCISTEVISLLFPPFPFPNPRRSYNFPCFDFYDCTPFMPVYFSLCLARAFSGFIAVFWGHKGAIIIARRYGCCV